MPDRPTATDEAPPIAAAEGGRWPRRLLLGAASLIAVIGLGYLGACIVDAARQEDPGAIAFSTSEPAVVVLAPGESRIVYLDPVLDGPMSLEIQPDTLDCHAAQGSTSVPVTVRRESRYVRSERPSWSVGEITATSGGEHRISCTDHTDRSLPLLLATPGPVARPLFDPVLGTVVALAMTAIAAVTAITTVVLGRRPAPSGSDPT